MTDEVFTHCTERDERGNVFHIQSPRELGPRIVRAATAWYRAQPHHAETSEPEQGRQCWISVVEVAGAADRCWRYSPNA